MKPIKSLTLFLRESSSLVNVTNFFLLDNRSISLGNFRVISAIKLNHIVTQLESLSSKVDYICKKAVWPCLWLCPLFDKAIHVIRIRVYSFLLHNFTYVMTHQGSLKTDYIIDNKDSYKWNEVSHFSIPFLIRLRIFIFVQCADITYIYAVYIHKM